jgi:hypothetical protein
MRPFDIRSQIPRKYLELRHNLFLRILVYELFQQMLYALCSFKQRFYSVYSKKNTSFTVRYTLTV